MSSQSSKERLEFKAKDLGVVILPPDTGVGTESRADDVGALPVTIKSTADSVVKATEPLLLGVEPDEKPGPQGQLRAQHVREIGTALQKESAVILGDNDRIGLIKDTP